jgi:predicted O-methyltransferase YrrM
MTHEQPGDPASRLDWISDTAFVLGGTRFTIEVFAQAPSTRDSMVLAKPRWLVQEYLDLATEFIGGNVVELGIAQGGSVAFFAHLLRPRRFLALELQARSNAALDAFLQDHDLSDSVRTAYGIDQSDVRRVSEVVDEHFGHHDLDLVVDDASHLQLPTAASFDVLFPRLRPGGVYVLEDWSTGHTWERVARALDAQRGEQRSEPYVHEETDLSRIVLDLVMTAAYSPETVAELRILNGFMYARRGTAPLDPESFALRRAYGDIGAAHFSS